MNNYLLVYSTSYLGFFALESLLIVPLGALPPNILFRASIEPKLDASKLLILNV